MSGVEDARYKACLVAKGYSQVAGIDFNDVFSLVVKHSFIRVLLSLVAMYNLELEQLDVKTVFLHGEFKESFTCISLKFLLLKAWRIMYACLRNRYTD